VETLMIDSEPLGVFSSAELKRKDLRVAPGDRFYMYTDGLIESKACYGRPEGLEKLIEACVRQRKTGIENAARLIALELRPGPGLEDDVLLMAVEACP
jgi:sigma-B regulation protein RsbU (phosphoserine phosphatase)